MRAVGLTLVATSSAWSSGDTFVFPSASLRRLAGESTVSDGSGGYLLCQDLPPQACDTNGCSWLQGECVGVEHATSGAAACGDTPRQACDVVGGCRWDGTFCVDAKACRKIKKKNECKSHGCRWKKDKKKCRDRKARAGSAPLVVGLCVGGAVLVLAAAYLACRARARKRQHRRSSMPMMGLCQQDTENVAEHRGEALGPTCSPQTSLRATRPDRVVS